MTWTEKEPILARLGHRNFSCEQEYDEWFSEQDNPVQNRVRRAVREDQYIFSRSRNYFKTNKNYNDGERASKNRKAANGRVNVNQ